MNKPDQQEFADEIVEWLDSHCGKVVMFQCHQPKGHEGPCLPEEPTTGYDPSSRDVDSLRVDLATLDSKPAYDGLTDMKQSYDYFAILVTKKWGMTIEEMRQKVRG